MEKYENPIQHACDVAKGQVWIACGWAKPEGFCGSAWDSISAFVMPLAHGSGTFYDGWMKSVSCNWPENHSHLSYLQAMHPIILVAVPAKSIVPRSCPLRTK